MPQDRSAGPRMRSMLDGEFARGRIARAACAVAVAWAAVSLQGCRNPFHPQAGPCSAAGADCRSTGCCVDPAMHCFEKDQYWASCKASCTPGIDPLDPPQFRQPWSCEIMQPAAQAPPPSQAPPGWVGGTYVTGYWDCCKPSCAWPGKGSISQPVRSCAAVGGAYAAPAMESLCQGGTAATCRSFQPFAVHSGLSMGFAAAAVGGGTSGLHGDVNCGQCFELQFTNQRHSGGWGGAGPGLVGKRMIVQVVNIGYDVTGDHSFDLQIPGAGQGQFAGCAAQFPGRSVDCGVHYGGCASRAGCASLPAELQPGCFWRYDWLGWGAQGTNNPYVNFHRVRCPLQLTSISGSAPLDDGGYPAVM